MDEALELVFMFVSLGGRKHLLAPDTFDVAPLDTSCDRLGTKPTRSTLAMSYSSFRAERLLVTS